MNKKEIEHHNRLNSYNSSNPEKRFAFKLDRESYKSYDRERESASKLADELNSIKSAKGKESLALLTNQLRAREDEAEDRLERIESRNLAYKFMGRGGRRRRRAYYNSINPKPQLNEYFSGDELSAISAVNRGEDIPIAAVDEYIPKTSAVDFSEDMESIDISAIDLNSLKDKTTDANL